MTAHLSHSHQMCLISDVNLDNGIDDNYWYGGTYLSTKRLTMRNKQVNVTRGYEHSKRKLCERNEYIVTE